MQPYQQRVVDEHRDLTERLAKLVAFVESDRFDQVRLDEGNRMLRQRKAMESYAEVLRERIDAFEQ